MNRASVLRLRAEVQSDLSAFLARADEVTSTEIVDSKASDLALVALALHHAYSSVEAVLKRISRQIEGVAPEGADWHKSLLDAAALEVSPIRPALIGRDTLEDLHELRGFRHFLRNAYSAELKAEALIRHQTAVARLKVTLDRDFNAVLIWLAEVAEEQ